MLAETEGVFTETAGGVTVASAKKLIEQGKIKPGESVVLAITGNGLKTQEAIQKSVGEPVAIDASLASFEAQVMQRYNASSKKQVGIKN
jgi:threonine synthase